MSVQLLIDMNLSVEWVAELANADKWNPPTVVNQAEHFRTAAPRCPLD